MVSSRRDPRPTPSHLGLVRMEVACRYPAEEPPSEQPPTRPPGCYDRSRRAATADGRDGGIESRSSLDTPKRVLVSPFLMGYRDDSAKMAGDGAHRRDALEVAPPSRAGRRSQQVQRRVKDGPRRSRDTQPDEQVGDPEVIPEAPAGNQPPRRRLVPAFLARPAVRAQPPNRRGTSTAAPTGRRQRLVAPTATP